MVDSKTEGVRDALNAVALSEDGTRAFFYERAIRSIIKVDVLTGSRKLLKFSEKDLQKQRWLCYCLFYCSMWGVGEEPVEKLTIVWYKQNKKKFCFTTHKFTATNELTMISIKNYLPIDVQANSLGYSAQQRNGRVEAVFYELKAVIKQKYWHFEYDMKTMKLTQDRSGLLPNLHWELPFLSDQGLHFVLVRKGQSLLATLQFLDNENTSEWAVSDILSDPNATVHLSRRALWCACWHNNFGIFLVSRFVDGIAKAEIWALDVRMAAWKHIKTAIEFPGEMSNFAIRLFDNNHLFIHYDTSDGSSFLSIENLINDVKNAFADQALDEDVGIGLADVICPICLENYENPKTLQCGHSLCHSHLDDLTAKEPNLNVIRCPLCRAPSRGHLPTNYALKEAIEMLNKVRRSQTFDQRCSTCRLACLEEELWHCFDCKDPSQSVCANCTLKFHSTHELLSYQEYKENLSQIDKIQKELESQALSLYQNFQEELVVKFRQSVYEKVSALHEDCLKTYIRLNSGRLKSIDVQKRKAMCLKHFSFVFEEILRSSEEFVKSLEDSLFVENACSTLEALQKSTEI